MKRPTPRRCGSFFMCNWLEGTLNFLIPKPVEQDIDGEPVEHDWYCPLPEEIPEMYQRDREAEAIAEKADRLVRSKR